MDSGRRNAPSRETLEQWDRDDPLARFRDRFRLPPGVIYLDGNSLGALPAATPARLAAVVEREWGEGLIRSWNDAAWMEMPARVGDSIGRLVGAPAGSVVVGDSTSVNVFKLLAAALSLRPERKVILSETGNFPTDLYVAEGIARLLGRELRVVETEAIAGAIDGDVAVVMLTHVNYRSGAMHDMAAVTLAAHRAGALMLWDLAHSAGAVPVDLAGCDADLAVGCGYKFLNGGPGAPSFLYVAPRLQDDARFPITGWLGHAAPFAFEGSYRPAPGIARAVVGTPAVLGLAALEVGVDMLLEADAAALRAKSQRQIDALAALVQARCPDAFAQVTPDDPTRRGSQLSLAHPRAYEIMQALIDRGVIGDFRAPDILRFGITPLTLRHAELWDAAHVLAGIMATAAWRDPRFAVRRRVT